MSSYFHFKTSNTNFIKLDWEKKHKSQPTLLLYLHGSPLGEGDHKVLPLPVLLHHMGKDDMPVATGPSQLGAICGPGQTEHAACVGFLQCIGPLERGRKKDGGEHNS